MPDGKAAGVRCVQLDEDNRCRLFGDSRRPTVCRAFDYDRAICGDSREEALTILDDLERHTATFS